MPRQGTGFINPGLFFAANRGQGPRQNEALAGRAAREAGALGQTIGGLQTTYTGASGQPGAPQSLMEADPAAYAKALGQQKALSETLGGFGTQEGRSRLLGEAYGGGGGYTSGMRAWDAALSGAEGGGLQASSALYGGDILGRAEAAKVGRGGRPTHGPVMPGGDLARAAQAEERQALRQDVRRARAGRHIDWRELF